MLRGADLAEFKAILDASAKAALGRPSQLTILYESGADLVCQKTEKPAGVALRRFLADEVLPKLRRGEAILPSAEPPPPLATPAPPPRTGPQPSSRSSERRWLPCSR